MIADTKAYLSVFELGQMLKRLRIYDSSMFFSRFILIIALNYVSKNRKVGFQLWSAIKFFFHRSLSKLLAVPARNTTEEEV